MENKVIINSKDNVGVCLTASGDIPAGHKYALCDIKKGETVIKYGQIIGRATKDITKGEWVHTHNVKSHLDETPVYEYNYQANEVEKHAGATFKGFKRSYGGVGIRNEIYIIPTVGCVNNVCMRLEKEARKLMKGSIDGIYALTHQFGCSQLGQDNENIKNLNPRIENYILNNPSTESKQIVEKPKENFESMNITQGKLVLGLDVLSNTENLQAIAIVYNAILGDGANSMLFQNVREKAGLAYSAKSNFVKQKLNIFIRCGIQIENYDKALEIIKLQLENLKLGNFTEEELENAKTYLIAGIKNIEEEQDTEVVFYIGQEIAKTNLIPEEYIKQIEEVSMEDVILLANSVNLNTIYFLKN